MRKNFHETFGGSEVALPSDRSTGFVFAAVSAIVAGIFWRDILVFSIAAAFSVVFLGAALIRPQVLRPLNIVWFKFGLLLHKIVNPIVMLLMFAVAIIPTGLLVRLWRDPLRVRPDKAGPTYWVRRDASDLQPSSMKNQF